MISSLKTSGWGWRSTARGIATVLLTASLSTSALAQPGPRVDLVAELLEFTENSFRDRFADGPPFTYHSSTFRVLAPEEYCGKTLPVYHAQVPAAESPWRRVGRVYRLSVSAERAQDLLEPDLNRTFLDTWWVQIANVVAVDEIPRNGCAADSRAESGRFELHGPAGTSRFRAGAELLEPEPIA